MPWTPKLKARALISMFSPAEASKRGRQAMVMASHCHKTTLAITAIPAFLNMSLVATLAVFFAIATYLSRLRGSISKSEEKRKQVRGEKMGKKKDCR